MLRLVVPRESRRRGVERCPGRWHSLRRRAVASGSSQLRGTVFDGGLSARPFTVPAMTKDNGFCYRGRLFNEALAETGIVHKYCRPYGPQTNGKACEHHRDAAPDRSDPGQGVTVVSFARFVGRPRCCVECAIACFGKRPKEARPAQPPPPEGGGGVVRVTP